MNYLLRYRRSTGLFVALLVDLVLVQLTGFAYGQSTDYFAIQMTDQLIGYAEVVDLGFDESSQSRLVRNRVRLRIAIGDNVKEISIDGQTQYDAEARITGFSSHIAQGDDWSEVTCVFDGLEVTAERRSSAVPEVANTEHQLPENWVLIGANDFGHWIALAQKLGRLEEETVDYELFTPEGDGTTVEFSGRRIQSLERDPMDSERWDFGDMSVLVDASSGRFIELDIRSQQTRITPTSDSVIDDFRTAPTADLLARHFIRSPERLSDSASINQMQVKLKVTVIGSGPSNPASILDTVMQSFDGDKQDDLVEGILSVQAIDRPQENLPAFPLEIADEELMAYLLPEPLIESDAPEIVEQAKSLTANATDRWQAVAAIAKWTFETIRYKIADSPSALMALQKREGDCGPHSTLAVAMLRSQGIPARLAGGLVYTPSFGGSFGQHVWVEVHMGEHGWIAFDPTTGEIERMNATHLKLFEGVGGVIPESIEILGYQPQSEPLSIVEWNASRPFSFPSGEEFRYVYRLNGKELGTETFSFDLSEAGVIALTVNTDLDAGGARLTSEVTYKATIEGVPSEFERSLSLGLRSVLECEFREGKVFGRNRSGLRNRHVELDVNEATRFFDNNLISSFALMGFGWQLEEGKRFEIETYHASSMTLMPLTFEVGEKSQLAWGDEVVEGWWCEVSPISNRFFFDSQGRLLRVEQGDLVIELVDTTDSE